MDKLDNLGDMLAEAAEVDLGAPMSLIHDAWDICEADAILGDSDMTVKVSQIRAMFLEALETACLTYDANQTSYSFNTKAL